MNGNKKMGVVVATAMSITIIIGAGLLALPGLSYALAGRFGYLSWVLVSILMIPLLFIFSYFSSNNPSAGGVIGYIRESLGENFGSMAEMIVLGTFTLGIPAIALIGSGYIGQIFKNITPLESGLAFIFIAYLTGMAGLRISGAIQTGMAALIIIGLTGIGLGFLLYSHNEPAYLALTPAVTVIQKSELNGIFSAIPVILFAYTGWEMTAFLAEDMENPKRDMPISIWVSFFIVAIMYIFIAWIVASFAIDNEQWKTAPFVELAKGWMGDSGGLIVAIIAVLLVIANVIAAFVSASRAIYYAGRDGFLPDIIGTSHKNGQPIIAMTITWTIFSFVIGTTYFLELGVDTLLQLAGQNFFALYLLCAIGYTKIHKKQKYKKILGMIAIALVFIMLFLFSIPGIIYCTLLAITGFFLASKKPSTSPN